MEQIGLGIMGLHDMLIKLGSVMETKNHWSCVIISGRQWLLTLYMNQVFWHMIRNH